MKSLLKPFIHNIPLFIISTLLLGILDIAYHQYLFHENTASAMVKAYGEIVFMASIFCILSWVLRKIYFKILIYIFLFIIYIINSYLYYAYSTDITPNIVLILAETNNKEISGFFETYLTTPASYKTIFVVVVFLVATIIGEYYNSYISKKMESKYLRIVLSLTLLFGVIFGSSAIGRYNTLFVNDNPYYSERWIINNLFYKRMPIGNLCYSINAIYLSGKQIHAMVETTERSLNHVASINNDSLDIVLIIGESYNKYHSGLYNYLPNTTPLQCRERDKGNLYAFTNVKAPHNMTSIVLKNVLCCNNVHESEQWYNSPFFPALFKKAGYNVYLWDNQYQQDHNYPWSFTLNSVMYNDRIMQMAYTEVNEKGYAYDDGLISDFENKKLSKLGKKNLIVFHLWGQHLPANTQFPNDSKHKVFSIKDVRSKASYLNNESRQAIADYDNATLYNDEVVFHVMNLFRNKNAILVYFPDHGEEIYDYKNSCGRFVFGKADITPQQLKYQFEIPFVVWCSDQWKQKHNDEWQNIGQCLEREFTTDNVCHLLFRLAGIKTQEYKPSRDLFSPEFIPQTKKYSIFTL